MTKKAKVTIGRCGDDRVTICIEDDASGILISEASLTLEGFANALMGRGDTMATLGHHCTPKQATLIGKRCVVERVYCEKTYGGAQAQKALVLEDFKKHYEGEWEIRSDGTRSQQNATKHQYIIVKWVDDPDE